MQTTYINSNSINFNCKSSILIDRFIINDDNCDPNYNFNLLEKLINEDTYQ